SRLPAGPEDRAEGGPDDLGVFAVGEVHLSWANDTTKRGSAVKGRRRRSRYRIAFLARSSAPAPQLQLEALRASLHGPPVVGGEDRPEGEAPVAEEPPSGEAKRVGEHIEDLLRGGAQPPAGEERVLGGHL